MEQGGFVLPSSHSHSEGVIDIAFSPVSRVRGLLEKKKKSYLGTLPHFSLRYRILCFCLLLYFLWPLSLLFLFSFLSGFLSFFEIQQKWTFELTRVPHFTGEETEALRSDRIAPSHTFNSSKPCSPDTC